MPTWWDEELVDSPSANQQAVINVAKLLNLDISSVLDNNAELQFRAVDCKYKKAGNKAVNELIAGTGIINSLAHTVADITKNEFVQFSSADNIRSKILNDGNPWVGFLELASYCWEQGVPVLYIPELPVSKKMDALVVNVKGRPVIALTKKHRHDSQLLFLLAHEMGHVFHGHVGEGQTLVDEKINKLQKDDYQELEANQFAIHLLTGKENTKYHSKRRLYAKELAHAAVDEGKNEKIDPGHIILNWGHSTKLWAIANSALNLVSGVDNWVEKVNTIAISNMNTNEANEEQLEYLYRLMQIGQ